MEDQEKKKSCIGCSFINCMTSVSLACYICCKRCQINKVRNAFIFLPPPSSYQLRSKGKEVIADDDHLIPPPKSYQLVYQMEELLRIPAYIESARHAHAYRVETSRKREIVLVHVPPYGTSAVFPKPEHRKRPVIIHCHGNATDMGLMMLTYLDLATTLKADVIGLEYTGFGATTALGYSPDHRDIDADMEAAYNFVRNVMQVAPEDIIFYGQSVGSAPAMSVASRMDVAGVILHSPMLSGIKVLDPEPDKICRPSQVFRCFDIFPNYHHMKETNASVLIIHGRQDDVIPFQHAARLNQIGKRASADQKRAIKTYFPENCGHNDITEMNRQNYYRSIHDFMRMVLANRSYDYGKGFGQYVVRSMSTMFRHEISHDDMMGAPSQDKMSAVSRNETSINMPENSNSLRPKLPSTDQDTPQRKNEIPGTIAPSDPQEISNDETTKTDNSIILLNEDNAKKVNQMANTVGPTDGLYQKFRDGQASATKTAGTGQSTNYATNL